MIELQLSQGVLRWIALLHIPSKYCLYCDLQSSWNNMTMWVDYNNEHAWVCAIGFMRFCTYTLQSIKLTSVICYNNLSVYFCVQLHSIHSIAWILHWWSLCASKIHPLINKYINYNKELSWKILQIILAQMLLPAELLNTIVPLLAWFVVNWAMQLAVQFATVSWSRYSPSNERK